MRKDIQSTCKREVSSDTPDLGIARRDTAALGSGFLSPYRIRSDAQSGLLLPKAGNVVETYELKGNSSRLRTPGVVSFILDIAWQRVYERRCRQ
jgi:hypothetical protein